MAAKRLKYRLEGLDCANCAAKIEEKALTLHGVQTAAMNFVEKTLTLTAAEGDYTNLLQEVCNRTEAGIKVVDLQKIQSHEHGHGEEEHGGGSIWQVMAALLLFVLGLIPMIPEPVRIACLAFSAIVSAYPVVIGAVGELKNRSLGEHMLLVIALIAAFAIGEYSEGALVALLFTVGELLENFAVGRSRRQIKRLAEIRPDRARRFLPDGSTEEINADAVEIGDRLLIPAHERVPVDSIVIEGASEVDTSALTGESLPVYVSVGTALMSGTMNGNGTLTVEATAQAESSAAARILDMVSDSAARKGRSERFITRFARIYTPVVTLAALLLAVMPPLLGFGEWQIWIYRALVFLVAACPCALVISVPLGFYAGIGAASRQGVLIKGGRFVEALAKTQAVAFDKTGTLTTGELQITAIKVMSGMEEKEALRLAAIAERYSAHPTAKAIVRLAGELPEEGGTEVTELPAMGVSAYIDGRAILCGGRRLMDKEGIDIDGLPGDAPVYLAIDGRAAAAFEMASVLQKDTVSTVRRLKEAGISRIAMLTGDRKAEAERIAAQADIQEVHAELLPGDKLEILRKIRSESGSTVFVGDGVNDAPVLAEADAGVAMGLGSSAAIESGDVVLTAGSLGKLPDAIHLSRRVMGVVRFNIVFALTVKAAVLILAACGYAPMWAAVFADVGVSVLSVLNAARLLLK